MTKLTQPGNTKLGSHTHMFNLPATHEVCNRLCAGCYAAREQVRFPSVLKARQSRLEAALKPDFASRIKSELSKLRKPPKFFRLHASGEFISQSYIDAWLDIASSFPSITFYAYTKRLADFDFTALSNLPNFVLINSLHFGKLNYGSLDQAPADAFICPSSDTIKCGLQCQYCMTKQAQHESVYFIKH
jgi:sulfatase maturation enzyme AslB (radical SAM superfamily)